MAQNFKNVVSYPIQAGNTPYVCPANTQAVVLSALSASTLTSNALSLGIVQNGASSPILAASNVSVNTASGVNMLAGKLLLSAGDAVFTQCLNGNGVTKHVNKSNIFYGGGYGEPKLVLSNASGSILVVATATGIYSSIDGGKTWALRNASTAVGSTGVFFGGAFYLYTSATNCLKSTDGITFTSTTCVNAPTVGFNASGAIIVNGANLVSMTSTQLITSSDGLNWSNLGAAFPAACATMTWTGTNYVVANGASNGNIYYSTNGAAWSTVSVAASFNGVAGGLASVGSVVLLSTSSGIYRSLDSGVTWTNSGSTIGRTSSYILSTGQAFIFTVSGSLVVSTNGQSWSIVQFAESPTISTPFALSSASAYFCYQYLTASSDLILTPNANTSVILSIMEIS